MPLLRVKDTTTGRPCGFFAYCDRKLLRATLTASLMLVAIAGAAVAGPLEDAVAASERHDYRTALRLFRLLRSETAACNADGIAHACCDSGCRCCRAARGCRCCE